MNRDRRNDERGVVSTIIVETRMHEDTQSKDWRESLRSLDWGEFKYY